MNLGNFAQQYMSSVKANLVDKKKSKIENEKNLKILAEKVKLLDELDSAIEDFVPAGKRIDIFLKGLEVLKTGDEGKRQVMKAFNKLSVQYNLNQERELKLFGE